MTTEFERQLLFAADSGTSHRTVTFMRIQSANMLLLFQSRSRLRQTVENAGRKVVVRQPGYPVEMHFRFVGPQDVLPASPSGCRGRGRHDRSPGIAGV